jgi:hypothetical protein
MDGLKESKQAVGAATLARVNNLAPPTILDQASRIQFSTRLFNLLVTNIPGPQFPLHVLGRKLEDLFPVAFLPRNHALAVAIMSYDGGIDYGLLGDYDALPDIDLIADGLRDSLQELVAAARAKASRHPLREPLPEADGKPVPILPARGSRPKHGPAADMRAKRTRRGRAPARRDGHT